MGELNVITKTFTEEVAKTAAALRQGQVILYPTDTIWGLGCDATNKSAVERIYEIKHRSHKSPLIILVDSIAMLKNFVVRLHPRIETLLSYHVRPLTIIYKEVQNLPVHLLAANGSIAIRICNDQFCKAVIRTLGRPVISTSANYSGRLYPQCFNDIDALIKSEVDYITQYKLDEKMNSEPSIIASYNKKGELSFIRE